MYLGEAILFPNIVVILIMSGSSQHTLTTEEEKLKLQFDSSPNLTIGTDRCNGYCLAGEQCNLASSHPIATFPAKNVVACKMFSWYYPTSWSFVYNVETLEIPTAWKISREVTNTL